MTAVLSTHQLTSADPAATTRLGSALATVARAGDLV